MELADVMTTALTKALKHASPNVVMTTALLSSKYGPTVDLGTLSEILGVKETTIKQYISREVFPIPVTKMGANWYATCFDIAEYLDRNKTDFRAA